MLLRKACQWVINASTTDFLCKTINCRIDCFSHTINYLVGFEDLVEVRMTGKKSKNSDTPSWEVDFYMNRLHRWLLLAKVPGEPSYEDKDKLHRGLTPRKEEFGSEEFFQRRNLKPERLKKEIKRRTGSEEFTPLIPGELPPRFIPDKEWKRKARERIKELNEEIGKLGAEHPTIKKRGRILVLYQPTEQRIERCKRAGRKYRIAEPWEVQLRELKYEKYCLECNIRGTNPYIERLGKEIEEYKKLRKQFVEESMERNKDVIDLVKRRLEGKSADVESAVFSAFFQLFVEYDPRKRKSIPSKDRFIADLLYMRALNRVEKELGKIDPNKLIEKYGVEKIKELFDKQEFSPKVSYLLSRCKEILLPREYEVIEKICCRLTNPEIAKEMGVTRQRIEAIIKSIRKKLERHGIGLNEF